ERVALSDLVRVIFGDKNGHRPWSPMSPRRGPGATTSALLLLGQEGDGHPGPFPKKRLFASMPGAQSGPASEAFAVTVKSSASRSRYRVTKWRDSLCHPGRPQPAGILSPCRTWELCWASAR